MFALIDVNGEIETWKLETWKLFPNTNFAELDTSCFDLLEKSAFKVLSMAAFWREQNSFLFRELAINS